MLESRGAATHGREYRDTSVGLVWCRPFLSPLCPRLACGLWLCRVSWLLALLLLLHLVRQLLNPLAQGGLNTREVVAEACARSL